MDGWNGGKRHYPQKQTMIKKIVVIGPESTGKSTLCGALAHHFNTLWCPEYAREFLLKNGTNYHFDDLADIAHGQMKLEDECTRELENQVKSNPTSQPSSLLFIDTDMYVMKVWCEFVFNQCHPFILDEIVKRQYDLYLLCNTDLPWVKDELREYPDLATRETLFRIYKDLLINQNTPWVEITGNNEKRLQIAINTVNSIL